MKQCTAVPLTDRHEYTFQGHSTVVDRYHNWLSYTFLWPVSCIGAYVADCLPVTQAQIQGSGRLRYVWHTPVEHGEQRPVVLSKNWVRPVVDRGHGSPEAGTETPWVDGRRVSVTAPRSNTVWLSVHSILWAHPMRAGNAGCDLKYSMTWKSPGKSPCCIDAINIRLPHLAEIYGRPFGTIQRNNDGSIFSTTCIEQVDC